MSEFIKRMQARIKETKLAAKARLNAVAQNTDKSTNSSNSAQGKAVSLITGLGQKITTSLNRLAKGKAGFDGNLNGAFINPMSVSKSLTYLLMLACAVSATYWLMRVAQIPSAPGQAGSGINSGLSLIHI